MCRVGTAKNWNLIAVSIQQVGMQVTAIFGGQADSFFTPSQALVVAGNTTIGLLSAPGIQSIILSIQVKNYFLVIT